MTKRVVHFTDATIFGGAERMMLTVMGAVDQTRWQPVLMYHPDAGIEALVDGARKLNVQTKAVPRPRSPLAPAGVPALAGALRRLRPSVFHAHLNWPFACTRGLLAARLARVPAVVATQQLFVASESPRFRLMHKAASLLVHRYIAVSAHMARSLARFCASPGSRIRLVHNAVAASAFAVAAAPEPCANPVVLTLARLDYQKGLPYLLEAAALLPDATFVVAGEGSEREPLAAMARNLGVDDRVRFVGHRTDVAELLAACHLFVLPSLFEGLPVSVLEAMAAARPVVATAVPGTDEVVQHERTGLLVPPRDPAALAAAIRRVLDDPRLARKLGEQGRARVEERFSAERMGVLVNRIYGELTGGNGLGHSGRPA